MPKHYVEVSDAVWAELVRVQKLTKVDKHALTDDVFALAGDLEAIAENHVDVEREIAQAPEDDERTASHSTRAAVLEPTTAEELADLI